MDMMPLAQSDAMDEEYGKAAAIGDSAGAAGYDRVQRSAYYGKSSYSSLIMVICIA